MKNIWNTLLGPVLLFLGTIIAPAHVIVSAPLTYVWIILLQIPVAVVVTVVSSVVFGVLIHGILAKGSMARLVILFVLIVFAGAFFGTLGFFFMDKILPGLTINGFTTYFILGMLYGMLSTDYKTRQED